jgi:hypothetical protein
VPGGRRRIRRRPLEVAQEPHAPQHVLAGLRKAGRLSESFYERLLSWTPSGFSAYGKQVAHADEPGKLERMARYIARAPFALGKIRLLPQDRVRIDTPPDSRTGATHVEMDALANSVITASSG